jgi:hypothetical protein
MKECPILINYLSSCPSVCVSLLITSEPTGRFVRNLVTSSNITVGTASSLLLDKYYDYHSRNTFLHSNCTFIQEKQKFQRGGRLNVNKRSSRIELRAYFP